MTREPVFNVPSAVLAVLVLLVAAFVATPASAAVPEDGTPAYAAAARPAR